MRTIHKFVIIVFSTMILAVPFHSCSEKKSEEEIRFLQSFYQNYMSLFASDLAGRTLFNKLDSMVYENCSESLILALPKKQEKEGGDVFLKAQDFNESSLTTLKVEPSNGGYEITYSWPTGEVISIHCKVGFESDKMVITDVW